MPQIFKIGSYWVYFWANENKPLEPVHVHVSKGKPTANATKFWIIYILKSDTVLHTFFCFFQYDSRLLKPGNFPGLFLYKILQISEENLFKNRHFF